MTRVAFSRPATATASQICIEIEEGKNFKTWYYVYDLAGTTVSTQEDAPCQTYLGFDYQEGNGRKKRGGGIGERKERPSLVW